MAKVQMVNILYVDCHARNSQWFKDFGCLKYVDFTWNTFHNYSRLALNKTKSEWKKRNKRLCEGTTVRTEDDLTYQEMLYICVFDTRQHHYCDLYPSKKFDFWHYYTLNEWVKWFLGSGAPSSFASFLSLFDFSQYEWVFEGNIHSYVYTRQ